MSDEFKLDVDLDLSKYDYRDEGVSDFSLEDILGISADKTKADNKQEATAAIQSDEKKEFLKFDEFSADPFADTLIAKDGDEAEEPTITFTVPEILIEKDADEVMQERVLQDETPILISDDDMAFVPNEESSFVEQVKEVEPQQTTKTNQFTVNVAAFDQIKAENTEKHSKTNVAALTQSPQKSQAISKPADGIKKEVINTKQKAQVIDEYSSIEEREDILSDLKLLTRKITGKIFVMAFMVLGCLYMTVGRFGPLEIILPAEIKAGAAPKMYCLIFLVLSTVCFLLNISPLFDGFRKMFRGRLTADGISFCVGICCIVYDVYLWMHPEKFAALPINFDIFFVLCLLMNLIGKRLLVKNIYANFELISKDQLKTVIKRPESCAVDNDVMVETGSGGDILYAARTKTIADYMKRAFAEQNVNRKTDVFYFVCFAAVAVLALSAWIFKVGELHKILVFLLSTVSMIAPIFSVWSHTWYTYKLGQYLRDQKTMISGREGAAALAESGVLVVMDTDVLSSEDISLLGLRVRDDYNVTDVMVTLSAFYHVIGGPMEGFFDKFYDPDDSVSLPSIEDAYYHDQLGYTFLADGKQIAIGSAEFMRHLQIDISHEADEIAGSTIYVAGENNVVGFFSVSYKLSMKTTRALQMLESEGVAVAIVSRDFNVSEKLFAKAVSDPEIITLLSDETAVECQKRCYPDKNVSADVVTYDRIHGLATGISGCSRLLLGCIKHSAYKITASVFGFVLIAAVLFLTQQPSVWLPVQIVAYHLLWNVPNFFRALKVKIN